MSLGPYYDADPTLRRVVDSIADGTYSAGDRGLFQPIVDSLLDNDEYLLLADFQSYLECQDRVE